MRALTITLLFLLSLGGCRFHQRMSLDVLAPDPQLAGTWQADKGSQKIVVRSLGDGRYRMLVSQGAGGHILDAHLSQLGGRPLLQANLIASVHANQKPTPPSGPAWLFMTFERRGDALSIRWVKPVAGVDAQTPRDELTRLVDKALASPNGLDEPVSYKRTEAVGGKRL